jgi:hypothetical protein
LVLRGEESYVHSEDEISHFHCDYLLGFKAFVLSAQSLASGGIVGTVTDPSGGFMPKVNVALNDTGTAETRETSTDSEGPYRFSPAPAGSYPVTMTESRFRTMVMLQVTVGQVTNADVQLAVATGAQSIKASAVGAGLQTDDGAAYQHSRLVCRVRCIRAHYPLESQFVFRDLT